MPVIYSYPLVTSLSDSDLMLITSRDADDELFTGSVKYETLKDSILSSFSGTDNYIPKFYQGALVDSAIYQNGINIGIGTTSPGVALDINAGSGIKVQDTGDIVFEAIPASGDFKLGDVAGVGGSAYIASDLSTHIDFFGDGDVRFLNDGDVGIGTTTPASKLDVSGGDIRLSTNSTYLRSKDSASAAPRVLGMNSANTFYIGPIDSYAGGGIIYGLSSNVTYHGFWGGGGEKVRITSGGNVGIGTNSPSQKLDVVGSIEVSDGIYIGGTAVANKLDDYEEGTFTPTLVTTGTETNPITKQGRYTKIGNLVTVTIMISVTVGEFTTLSISECSNLPFTIRNESSFAGIRLRGVAEYDNATTDAFEVYCEGLEGTLRLFFRKGNSSIALESDSDNKVMAQITYEVE